ncbi:Zn-dependent hydrolases [Candidatus Vecturithrix granuli]|uniref:Zn-dependent hydrolases n=1 Tax=Vecturithrix granuli TaxID=1499967 RepID=A0A081BYT5_VECG1|nr:Zn-dependent hydrolases [Candidatus Vecturithrix granuli]
MKTSTYEKSIAAPSQRQRYHGLILQQGTLPLHPNRTFDRTTEHRCTTSLIWPEHSPPGSKNTIIIDPCFTATGYQYAQKQLKTLDISFKDLGYIFITHRHIDHVLTLPEKKKHPYFQKESTLLLPDIDVIPCPGHAPDLQALVFRSTSNEQVWVVGDAILNLRWLNAWQYYWPNVYTSQQVVQTWNSIAQILSQADMIIPGHGEQFYITAALLTTLLETFPSAEYARECPEVEPLLRQRQQQLLEHEAQSHATFSGQTE